MILVLSISGIYLRFTEGECEYINLYLAWENTIDVYEIEGNPAVRAFENEEEKLVETVSTMKSGVLRIIAKSEYGKPVWLTMTKGDSDSWRREEIEVYFQSIEGQLQSTSHPVWAMAGKDQDGLTLHTIIVEAFFLNEDCSKVKYAYIYVSKGSCPALTPPPNNWEELKKWFEENPFVIILPIAFFFFIVKIGKRKRRR